METEIPEETRGAVTGTLGGKGQVTHDKLGQGLREMPVIVCRLGSPSFLSLI